RRGDEALDGDAVARVVLQKNPVGKLGQTFFPSGDAEHGLDTVVVGREVLVLDRPVFAEAVVVLTFEFEITEPPGSAAPAQRLAADQADADPIIRIAGIV